MSNNFGHVQRVTKEVGGKTCTFRSLLEFRWCVWLQLQKEQGLINDWFFEDPDTFLELTERSGNKRGYLPDFCVEVFKFHNRPPEGSARCPSCGYTYWDCVTQGDHRLCGKLDPPQPDDWYAYEYHETKGWFSQKDYTKIKLASQQYDNPITLIFANLNANSKNSKTRANRDRAERIEKLIKRVIYDAQKTIFKPIKHLFEF